jgi:plasmid stability protein
MASSTRNKTVNITIKKVPRALHARLKKQATDHRRSLNSELIDCLTQGLSLQRVDPEEFLVKARRLRQEVGEPLTQDLLSELKNRGRP